MAGLPSGHRFKALALGVGQLIVLVPLMATW